MLAAAISLTFHGLLRVSEFTAPSPITHHPTRTLQTRRINIDMTNNSLSVFILASKTDQQAQGHKILIGCTGSTNCPIYLMQSYLDSCHHNTKHIPLFHFVSGKFLTWRTFSNMLYECLITAGVHPKRYSTHSLRIGGATAAALAGVHPSLIKDLGWWHSECYCAIGPNL